MQSRSEAGLDLVKRLLVETGYASETDEFDRTVTPKAIGMDSLTMLELLMLVEEHAGVELSADVVGLDTTLGELVDLIDSEQQLREG